MLLYNKDYVSELLEEALKIPNVRKLCGKSIFITGGNGLVCSHIVDILHVLNLEENFGIEIFLGGRSEERFKKRFYYLEKEKDYGFIPFDATTAKELAFNPNYIIHGAGMGDPKGIMDDPVGVMLSNINGVNSLIKTMDDGQRMLYISSSEVYGNIPSVEGGYSEEMSGTLDNLNPRSCYPMSKRTGETLCKSYEYEYGKDVVIVRPGHIYGPGITDSDSRVTAQFTRNAKRNEPIVMKSSGSQIRSYCYAVDCATGILTALINGEKGSVYNISNPNSISSIADMAKGFSEVSGCIISLKEASEEEKKSFNAMNNSSLNSDKLLSLGWSPSFDRIRGISSTLKYFDF